MSAQPSSVPSSDKMDACRVHAPALRGRAGYPALAAVQPTSGPEHASFARAFWLAQARWHLARAREWMQRFGSYSHWVAVHWFLHELAEAERYRRWAHVFGRMR